MPQLVLSLPLTAYTATNRRRAILLACDNFPTSAYSWILMSIMFPMATSSDDGGRGLHWITPRYWVLSGSVSSCRMFVRLECRRHNSKCSGTSSPGTFRKTDHSNNSNLRGCNGLRQALGEECCRPHVSRSGRAGPVCPVSRCCTLESTRRKVHLAPWHQYCTNYNNP